MKRRRFKHDPPGQRLELAEHYEGRLRKPSRPPKAAAVASVVAPGAGAEKVGPWLGVLCRGPLSAHSSRPPWSGGVGQRDCWRFRSGARRSMSATVIRCSGRDDDRDRFMVGAVAGTDALGA